MAAETTTETWTYAGRRNGRSRIVHAWIDETGAELYYGKIRGASIGSSYALDVDRTGDTVTIHGTPSYVNEPSRAEQADVERWRATDRAVEYAKAAVLAEKRAAADSELDDALDVLRRYSSRLRTYADQQAFRQWVAAEVDRPPRGADA